MVELNFPIRPRDYTETILVERILDGTFPPGSALPGERLLSAQLGVTRPTLREAIQRLTRDGWLTVSHGRATLVNDYWREGGLNVLSKLVEHKEELPPDFVTHLLEVRLNLAPAYTRAAVTHDSQGVAATLAGEGTLQDTPAAFAQFDWDLHHYLTVHSGNPIYPMILNGFRGFYQEVAAGYFTLPDSRDLSRRFYKELADAAASADPGRAEAVCRAVMESSIRLWEQREAATVTPPKEEV